MSSLLGKKKTTKKTTPASKEASITEESINDLDMTALKDSMSMKDVEDYSAKEVVCWLGDLGLNSAVAIQVAFLENSITGAALLELDDSDIKGMGVTKLGDRKKLTREIEKLKAKRAQAGKKDASRNENSSEGGSSASSADRIYFKLHYKDDVHALKVSPQQITLKTLKKEVKDIYGQRMRIRYKDDDGDYVSLRREQDLSTLVRDMQETSQKKMKLYLSPTEAVSTTEKEKTEAAKSAQFQMFDLLLDSIVVINESGIVQYLNAAAEKLTGFGAKELIGQNVNRLMTDEYAKFHDSYLKTYLKTRQSKIIGTGRDVVLQRKDGNLLSIRLSVTEKLIGEKQYYFGTLTKSAEQVVQKTMLQQEREVLDTLIVPSIIISENGIILGFNPAAQKFFGYSLVEVINKNINMLMLSPDKEKHDGYLKAYREGGAPRILGTGRKVIAVAKDGDLKTVFLSVTEKKDKGKSLFTGVLQDLDAHK